MGIKKIIKSLPLTNLVLNWIEKYLHRYWLSTPPGNYYSPIPSEEEHEKYELNKVATPEDIKSINLNIDNQIHLSKKFETCINQYETMLASKLHHYKPDNGFFFGVDAFILFSIMKEFRPGKIIEIGSGYSTALQLDICQNIGAESTKIICIDPYADRLRNLIKNSPSENQVHLLENKIQEIDLSLFTQLNSGDLLFVDSGHVVKSGSDVNWIHFEILPRLKSGVLIHFHDIFWPFTYPKEWVKKGIFWSEAYLVRSLLMSSKYKIVYFNSMMSHLYPKFFDKLNRPSEEPHSTSLYIQKI